MSYTTPTTRSTGNSISAANWNTDNVDNIKWIAGDSGGKPSCQVYNSANLAITTGTWTTLTFDSEQWDNGGMHSTVSNTGRITVPSGAGGKFDIKGGIEFEANSTGARAVRVRLDGSIVIRQISVPTVPAGTGTTALFIAVDYALSATQYVELQVFQDSSGNLNILASGNYSPYFSARWWGL